MSTIPADTIGNVFELIDSGSSIRVRLIDYGATVTNLWCPDRHGQMADVLLGCPTPDDHLEPHPHFNCIVGRYSNRITNAEFTLDGVTYQLDANIPPHQLHGGRHGFANRLWSGSRDENTVTFKLTSADGDSGYPGKVDVVAVYTLERNVLRLEFTATTTKPTPISLTAHHYFNLTGKQGSHIGDHLIRINADQFLPVSMNLTQLGRMDRVDATPFDFRNEIRLGDRLNAQYEQNRRADGFDHTFALNGTGLRQTASVRDPVSGRTLLVRTDQPGVQLYTCNSLDVAGKDGVRYSKHQGFCLETQQFPDAPNHRNYPNAILRPNEIWHAVTEYELGIAS